MVVAVAARDCHANSEQAGDLFLFEKVSLASVCLNLSVAHQDNAVDLRDDVGEVMRHQDDSDFGLGECAHGLPKFMLGENIQAVARLVKNQRSRIVDQRPGNQNAFCLAGGHFRNRPVGEMADSEPRQCSFGLTHLFGRDLLVFENAGAAEEAGEDHVAAAGLIGAIQHQIVGDDAEDGAQLKNIPSRASQDRYGGTLADNRVALARDGFDESRFAATVWSEDGDVLAGIHAKAEVVEGDVFSSNDAHIFKVNQSLSHKDFCPSFHIMNLLEQNSV